MDPNIRIRKIASEDYEKAIGFSMYGMHDNWYTDNPEELLTFERYFFYKELDEATQAFSATRDGKFVGSLLAKVEGEEKKYARDEQIAFVKRIDSLLKKNSPGSFDVYQKVNEEMFVSYLLGHNPEGELSFLVADSSLAGQGIGSALLHAFTEAERGKEVYVFTDSGCNAPFYEHRGFIKCGEKNVVFSLPKGRVPLTCFLYRKEL